MLDAFISAKGHCPDCGPVGVSHRIERLTARMDVFTAFLAKPCEAIWSSFSPITAKLRPGRMAPAFARFFEAIGFGSILEAPDGKNNWRARVLWDEADQRGIVMREFRLFGLPRELFFASNGRDTRAFDGLPRPRGARRKSLVWMDDKGIILEHFRRAGVPVPRGKTCKTVREAENILREIGGPVIVKPNSGSRSRHTYVHVADAAELHRTFAKAKELSPYVVVEEELSGFVFRLTFVGGRIAGVMRREPPHVIGDGKRTVRGLVEEENRNPLRHGPLFHKLEIDPEAEKLLASQGHSPDSVPAKGEMVILNRKVSRSYGASTTEIADIHPDNTELFGKIASVLCDPLVGVDFMIDDMALSWRSQKKSGVIECNSLPFIDLHHYPLKGPAKNVAGLVWDIAFPG